MGTCSFTKTDLSTHCHNLCWKHRSQGFSVRHSFSGLIRKPHRHSPLGWGIIQTAQACGVGLHTRSRTSRLEDFKTMPWGACGAAATAGGHGCLQAPSCPRPARCRAVIAGSLGATRPLLTSLSWRAQPPPQPCWSTPLLLLNTRRDEPARSSEQLPRPWLSQALYCPRVRRHVAARLLSGVPTLGGDLRTGAGFRKAKTSLLSLIPRTLHAVSGGQASGGHRGWGRTCRRRSKVDRLDLLWPAAVWLAASPRSPWPHSSGEAAAYEEVWAKI